jgi:hypothetical protein
MLLELATWKSQITQQVGWNSEPHTTDMRQKRRIDSVLMVTIIIPNGLSFLELIDDDDDSDHVVDSDDDGYDDEHRF